MKQAILTVSAMCVLASLCGQLMAGRRFVNAIRMVMGMEIIWIAISLANEFMEKLN